MDKDCTTCKNMKISSFIEPCKSCEEFSNHTEQEINYSAIETHTRALACFCECSAMNAENALDHYVGRMPTFSDRDYFEVMKKWNLIDDEGSPEI